MRLGIHMPLKGGFKQNVQRAAEIGCQTVQIFAGNPTGWKMGAADPEEIAKRVSLLEEQSITPLIIHSAYLINLASTSPDFYRKSVELLKATMERALLYRSPFVVMHCGNHGGAGVAQGLERIIETLAAELPAWPGEVRLLLENTAGGGTALGSRFNELASILESLPRDSLGICLDTAHAWAAGYDLSSERGVEETLEQFDRSIGLERLQMLHVNDAKTALGSKVDRHEHIGHGGIGLDGFKALLRRDWPAGFPVILETPEIGSEKDRENLNALKSLLDR